MLLRFLALVAAATAFSPSPRLGGVSRCVRGASNVQCIFQSEEERAARARESRAKALSGARLIGFTGGAVAGRQVWSELKAEGLVEDQPLKDALDGLDLPEIDTSALSGGDLSSLKPDLSSLKLPELPSEAPSFSAPKFEAPDFSSLKAPELPSFEKPDLSSFSAPDFSSLKAPELPAFEKPDLSGFKAPDFSGIKAPDFSGLKAPDLSGFKAPELPSFEMPSAPEMPSFDMSAALGVAPAFAADDASFPTTQTLAKVSSKYDAILNKVNENSFFDDMPTPPSPAEILSKVPDIKPEAPSFAKPDFAKPDMPKFEAPKFDAPKFDAPEMPSFSKPDLPSFS